MAAQIGPHTDRELQLMLQGEKKVAYFSDIVPEDDFKPYIENGQIVRRQIPFEGQTFHGVFFALPNFSHYIDQLHSLIEESFASDGDEQDDLDRKIGLMLGYSDEDTQLFLDNKRKRRKS